MPLQREASSAPRVRSTPRSLVEPSLGKLISQKVAAHRQVMLCPLESRPRAGKPRPVPHPALCLFCK